MLNKHYTTVLTLAILVTFGIIPKSLASSEKVQSDSSLEYHLATVKEDSSTSDSNLKANPKQIYNYADNLQDTLVAQDVSPVTADDGSSTEQNQSTKLWLLILVIIIIVPSVGFFLLKSKAKPETIDEEQATSENITSIEEMPASIPQNVTSELAVDSIAANELIQEDTPVEKNEEEINETIVVTTPDSSLDSSLLDEIKEQPVEDTEIESENDERQSELEDSQSLEKLSSSENAIDPEEIINELLDISKPELLSISVDDENFANNLAEESVVLEEVAQNQPDLLSDTENTTETELESTEQVTDQELANISIVSEEVSEEVAQNQLDLLSEPELEPTEQVTDQELANISEWLNEKIDSSSDKDVSVMDDFWNNISSITEEINAETIPEPTEKITDRELANISEWLDEKVSPDSNLNDLAANGVDNLTELVEGTGQDANEELLSNSFNIEEKQNYNEQTKEGISDVTSDFLEELLNEDSSKESKH